MDVQFVTSVAVIAPDPSRSQELYIGTFGLPLADDVTVRQQAFAAPPGDFREGTASCDPGEVAIGGAVREIEGPIDSLRYFADGGKPEYEGSHPPTGWNAGWWNPTSNNMRVEVYAICAAR